MKNFLRKIINKVNLKESREKDEISELITTRNVARNMIYLGENKALTQTIFGHKLFVNAKDISLTPHLLLDGFWELEITRIFAKTIKEGMTVVEVGTNIGYYTLIAASKVGKNGKVYAFEANPTAFDLLQQNVAINGFSEQVKIVNKAVFNESKKLEFSVLKRNFGSSSIMKFSEEYLKESLDEVGIIEVEAISLDEFFGEQPPKIDLIKIDAEGSEPYIFKGMREVIKCNPQVSIICEFAPRLILGMGANPRDFLEEVINCGFKLMKINTANAEPELLNVSIDELLETFHSELFITTNNY